MAVVRVTVGGMHLGTHRRPCWSSGRSRHARQEPGHCCQRTLDQRRSQSDRRRNGQLSSISSVPALAQSRSLGGRPPTIVMIVGPASRYFSAWARNFNSQAALPMSPLAADAASRLTLNSRRDAFFTFRLIHRSDQSADDADHRENAGNIAMIESMDGNSGADQFCRDRCLEIGEGEDEIRLEREDLWNVGRCEGQDARLLAPNLRWCTA